MAANAPLAAASSIAATGQRVGNIMAQVDSDKAAATFYTAAGQRALIAGQTASQGYLDQASADEEAADNDETSGWLGGAGSLFSGLSGAFKSGFFGGGSSGWSQSNDINQVGSG